MSLKYLFVPESKEMLKELLGMSTQHRSLIEDVPTGQIMENDYKNSSYRLFLIG